MTPGARVQAAIEVLTAYLDGQAAEQALTRWARSSRFAGSKDRAAVRDLVYSALRQRRSLGAWPDAKARLWIAALCKEDHADLFSGIGHAPDPLTSQEVSEISHLPNRYPDAPDWVCAKILDQHGDIGHRILQNLKDRAPVSVRVNRSKTSRSDVIEKLARDGIISHPNPLAETAITVTEGARKVAQSGAFQSGLIDVQDAASQAVCAMITGDGAVLDYCAGGGGKALALADHGLSVSAHDVNAARMKDIPARAKRADVQIAVVSPDTLGHDKQFQTVLCDVPCSGSGAWRRSPAARWDFSESDLDAYVDLQRQVVRDAMPHVQDLGTFVYATCSVFAEENQQQVDWILKTFTDLHCIRSAQFLPDPNGDGLFCAVFQKS